MSAVVKECSFVGRKGMCNREYIEGKRWYVNVNKRREEKDNGGHNEAKR